MDLGPATLSRRSLAAALVTAALVAGGCGTSDDPGSAGADPRSTGTALDAGAARRVGPPQAEPPVALTLPSGTVVRIQPATTLRSGVLDVPDDISEAGWWRGGARVGDPFGSTLVAGHVDAADQGLGAFAELLDVRRGQRVVLRSQHLEQRFTIRSRRLVPRDELPRAVELYAVRGPRRLTLVTCAPPYVRPRGGYQNLAAVTAVPTGPARTRSRS